MSEIEQHPLREDLSKFSLNGLRTFVWNELDNPPIELLEGIEKFRQDLINDGRENEFGLYYKEYVKNGLKCYEFKNPYRSGHLKLKYNKLSNPLASVFKQYNKNWVYTINGLDNVLMRAEIPMAHLDKRGRKHYANIFVKLMSCNYPESYWHETYKTDTALASEWLFCSAGIKDDFLIVYYLKPALWEVERQYLFEGTLISGNKLWKEYFLQREDVVSQIRTAIMKFPIQKRQYSFFSNAFEFAFQIENFIDDIPVESRFKSVEDLVQYGLGFGASEAVKYLDDLLLKRHKLTTRMRTDNSFTGKYEKMIEELREKEKSKWNDIIKHDKKSTQFKYNINDYD